MRFVEFLIRMLSAHAETLQALSMLLGEDVLVGLLENFPDSDDIKDIFKEPSPEQIAVFENLANPPPPPHKPERRLASPRSPYQELDWSVQELHLPALLSFYIWTYPPYRRWVESKIDLGACVTSKDSPELLGIIEQAAEDARHWTRQMPIPPQMAARVDAVVKKAWLKFRADMLKTVGQRPMQPVRL